MSDMAKLPDNTQTTKYLLEYGQKPIEEKRRSYLGMSGIGDECERKLWLGFRWAKKKFTDTRSKRIFQRGDLEEERVISDLVNVGMKVYAVINDEIVPLTGKVGEKQEEYIGFAGHSKGHSDGRIEGVIEAPKTVHLLEIKTMNNKNFTNMQKVGLKNSHPNYYAQAQRYMKAAGLTRALFVITNKDNEERDYIRIKFDKDFADDLSAKEREIIIATEPPFKRFNKTWWKCRWCNVSDVCHDGEAPDVNCRTCAHSDVALEGKWICGLNNDKELSYDDQVKGCKHYRRLF
jgi:hypothetical protein